MVSIVMRHRSRTSGSRKKCKECEIGSYDVRYTGLPEGLID